MIVSSYLDPIGDLADLVNSLGVGECRCGHPVAAHPCYHAGTETLCRVPDVVCDRCRTDAPAWRRQLVDHHGQSHYLLICDADCERVRDAHRLTTATDPASTTATLF